MKLLTTSESCAGIIKWHQKNKTGWNKQVISHSKPQTSLKHQWDPFFLWIKGKVIVLIIAMELYSRRKITAKNIEQKFLPDPFFQRLEYIQKGWDNCQMPNSVANLGEIKRAGNRMNCTQMLLTVFEYI